MCISLCLCMYLFFVFVPTYDVRKVEIYSHCVFVCIYLYLFVYKKCMCIFLSCIFLFIMWEKSRFTLFVCLFVYMCVCLFVCISLCVCVYFFVYVPTYNVGKVKIYSVSNCFLGQNGGVFANYSLQGSILDTHTRG